MGFIGPMGLMRLMGPRARFAHPGSLSDLPRSGYTTQPRVNCTEPWVDIPNGAALKGERAFGGQAPRASRSGAIYATRITSGTRVMDVDIGNVRIGEVPLSGLIDDFSFDNLGPNQHVVLIIGTYR
jgi:hypothetical protein